MSTRVYLEVGSSKVFACALDWPGWCRSAKNEDDALHVLADYAGRYAPVAATAGSKMWRLPPSEDRAALRSVTPAGFARAFFEANP